MCLSVLFEFPHNVFIFVLFNFFMIIYLFMAVLGLCCHADSFLASANGGHSLVAVRGLLIAWFLSVVERGL